MTFDDLGGTDRVLITVEETVQVLGGRIGRSALHEAINRGEFPPARRIGRRKFVSVPHLRAWLAGIDDHPHEERDEPNANHEREARDDGVRALPSGESEVIDLGARPRQDRGAPRVRR